MDLFPEIKKRGFDVRYTYHADAIVGGHFPDAARELDAIFSCIRIPILELVHGGGGEAKLTQRLRKELADAGWKERKFEIEKKIDETVTYSSSHKVDHVKYFHDKAIAAEIEWNNKDPFFDRDLENFYRLHQDGAISCGLVITRGSTFQRQIESRLRDFAYNNDINDISALSRLGINLTRRQLLTINLAIGGTLRQSENNFAMAWARAFKGDKFGASTTNWEKLEDRLERGVGSPCPLIAIGIPITCVTDT